MYILTKQIQYIVDIRGICQHYYISLVFWDIFMRYQSGSFK